MANLYLTQAEVEASLELTGTSHAQIDVERSLEAACRAIDNRCGRKFWQDAAPVTKLYRPVSKNYLIVDDISEPTSVAWGDAAKVLDTDYYYEASVASYGAPPYGVIRPMVGTFMTDSRSVTVVARFGFPTVPPEIKAATGIVFAQLLRRIREAPFGVLATSFDGAAIRIGRNDPQLDMLLGPFTRSGMIE